MGLAKDYCKEIIKELDKIPVFLPGTPVKVGDVITFGKGFIKPRPIGSFSPVTKLSELGIEIEVEEDNEPDPYLYASKGAVGVSFVADANAGSSGKGKLDINFRKEGSTYLAAVDCRVDSIKDTSDLDVMLEPHKNKIDWKNCFIVTSVTVAKKALIMQSNSESATLSVEGDVKGLQTGTDVDINASASVNIKTYTDSSFIKDWSDEVTVFFTLARYRKKFLGNWGLKSKSAMFINDSYDSYELTPLYPEDIFWDEE